MNSAVYLRRLARHITVWMFLFVASSSIYVHGQIFKAHPTGMLLSPMFADRVVGDTRDACDGKQLVKLESRSGEQSIPHSTNNEPVELPSMTREIYWYCGGSRERSANDTPFNKALVTRAGNGAIHWVFVVETNAAAASEPVRVGDTKDACDGKEMVTLEGTLDPVSVKAGEIKTAEISAPTREIFWTCGKSGERAGNPLAFNRVQIERAGNGAIQWVFYRTLSITSPDLGSFFHNAQGNILIDAPQAPADKQQETFALKQALDTNWNKQRQTMTTQLLQSLKKENLPVQNVQVTLATAAQSELRLEQSAQAITVKYVVHDNHATGRKDGGGVDITFDVEVVFSLPRSGTLAAEKTNTATAFVRHVEIEGDNVIGDVVVGVLKSKVRAGETEIGNFSQDISQIATQLNAQIGQVGSGIPVSPNLVTLNLGVDSLGNIPACATVGAAKCTFARPADRPVVPRVLDTSNDQCSQEKIWLWDSELGRFVSVSKGQSNVLVQVDDKRFEWYCGDDGSPDPSGSNEESASGPTGTFQVRVSRDKDGRGIHWQFLSWH